ncbi:MAG: bifunctional DNA primase/polymerase [Actinobacteria bacterium]|nr:bifunctional DNA primase/polymerase [Actinomycetota bacterium]MCA1807119.1 bifunctional DNA primase/polymerase [Actinomycetota bacterium]
MDYAKKFAACGYYVFPIIKKASKQFQPIGWAGNEVKDDKKHLSIQASNDVSVVDSWDEIVAEKYQGLVSGFGVVGRDVIIVDVDVKGDRNGVEYYDTLAKEFGFPKSKLVVKTKSGGIHLYFARPKKFKNQKLKSVSDIKIHGQAYIGVDIRGDGGFVRGPTSSGEWVEGEYTIIRGNPSDELSELPEEFLSHIVKASSIKQTDDADSIIVRDEITDDDEVRQQLKRGELPDKVPEGSRNESFFIFINALKSKGFNRSTARALADQLADRCENKDDLHESVDIDDMIERVFEVDSNNPYDIASDIMARGFYQLTNYQSGKIMYILPHQNPYLTSRYPHAANSMRELMSKYERVVVAPTGREKKVNPIDLIIPRITDDYKVDSVSFKPGSPEVFTMGADFDSAKYLNTYRPPPVSTPPNEVDYTVFNDEFKVLISRIFGPPGTDEYQLGLDFPAWLLQNPGIKMSIAPMLLSKVRGVGKSLFFNLMQLVLGSNAMGDPQGRMVKLEEMTGRFFNPTSALLNMVDEVQFGLHRNVRQEMSTFWRHLKNIVTAETQSVEIKNGPTLQLPNSAGLILAGNSDGFVPMEEGDRRIWVIDNNAKELEPGVVDRLFDIVKGTGSCRNPHVRIKLIESLRHCLRTHQIAIPLDTVRAPMSDLKVAMIRSSMTDAEDWLMRYFEDHENLLAKFPLTSHSALRYILQTSDQIMDESWRDSAESLIRDFKRKGILRKINRGGKQRKFNNIPTVLITGDVAMASKADTLYAIDGLSDYDNYSDDEIRMKYFQNLQTLKRPKLMDGKNSVDVNELMRSGNA